MASPGGGLAGPSGPLPAGQRSVYVYPVPSFADDDFFRCLFGSHAQDVVLVGPLGVVAANVDAAEPKSGSLRHQQRVAFVDLDDSAFTTALLEMLARPPQAATVACRGAARKPGKRRGKAAAGDAPATESAWSGVDPGMTIADLFADTEANRESRAKEGVIVGPPAATEEHRVPSVDEAGEPQPHILHATSVVFGGRVLHISPSAVSVQELRAAGLIEAPAAAAAAAVEGAGAASRPRAPRGKVDIPTPACFPPGSCQRCGSKDHFTRNCTGSGASRPVDNVGSSVPAVGGHLEAEHDRDRKKRAGATVPRSGAAAPARAFPPGSCKRCGSKDHFTRHCTGAAEPVDSAADTRPEPVDADRKRKRCDATLEDVEPAAPESASRNGFPRRAEACGAAPAKPVVPKRPMFERVSKDQCKFCGTVEHLSRHCPSK